MANPIPYNKLFDIDGLKMAIKEAEAESNNFSSAATEDFKRINNVVKSLKKELEGLGVVMSKPIKLMDDSGQEQIRALSRQVADLTQQYKTQKSAIDALKGVMDANKQAISDARVQSAQYEAQLKKERVATQEARTATANLTLEMKRQAQANREAAQAQTAATGSYKEAQQRLTALGNAIRNTKDGFTSTSPALQAQIKEYNTLNDALKKFDAQMGNHQRNVGNYKSALGGITDSLKSLVLGYVGIQGAIMLATKSFDVALSSDAIKTSLAFTLKSAEAADDKLKDLKSTANRLGLDFIPLAKSYSMFAGAASAANFPLEQTNRIFNSISGAAARFHLTSDQLTGSLLAIQQMISKGTVQSEELRGQLGERLPGAFSIAARAMGVTEKELGKLLQSGQVLASDLLPKLADELDKTFSLDANTKIDSLTASTNRLKTAFDTALQGDGIGKVFKQIVDGSTAAIQSIDKLVKSRSWTEFFGRLTDFNASEKFDAINGIQDNFSQSKNARSGFNPIGASNKIVVSALADKPLEELEQLRKKFLTAATQASAAVNTYRKGIASGLVADGGKNTLKEVEENFKAAQSALAIVNTAYGMVLAKTPKVKADLNSLTDDQLTSIEAIRKRIAELSKLPGSAIDGSDVNNRIDALKKRLKDLLGATKEAKTGLELLEAQLKKVLLELQNQIILDDKKNKGEPTKRTKELADAYTNLAEQIKRVKEAQDEAEKAALNRYNFNNRGKQPYLQTTGAPNTPDAAGIANALSHSALTKEYEDTINWQNKIEEAYAATNQNIFKAYSDRKLSLSQYNKEIQTAQDSAADDIFAVEKRAAELRIQLAINEYGKGSKEYRAALKALGDLQDNYNKESLARDERLYAAKLKLQQETISILQKNAAVIARVTGNSGLGNLFGDISTNLINGIGDGERFQKIAEMGMDAIGTYTEFAINASNMRIDQLNKEKEHDLSLAGNNAEAKMKIEEEYNQKVTAEKRKAASMAKIAAIAEIVINTAVAITKTAAVTGPLAFLIAPALVALGAIQAGIVLATPLPQYAKGRNGGPAELAEVNERGPELIGQKGKWRLANRGMRGVTYLNQGDQVKTATDTKQMLANGMITADGQYVTNVSQSKSIYDQYVMASSRSNDIDYHRMAGAVADGVSGLPVTEHNWNERGYQQNIRTKNTRILDINRRNRF